MHESDKALIIVDFQNDFVDPCGSLYVRGAESVAASINDKIVRAHRNGWLIVYTQDWHPEVTPHFAEYGGTWPVHCLADSWGAELHPSLRLVEEAETVRKGVDGEDGYSGFSVREPESDIQRDTILESMLRWNGVSDLTVVGIATDYCVKETVLDALKRGFNATVIKSCIKGVDLEAGDSEAALRAMSEAGAELSAV